MLGMATVCAVVGTNCFHTLIDALHIFNAHLLQLFHKADHDQAADHRIIRRPVVIKFRQAQGICYNIELETV